MNGYYSVFNPRGEKVADCGSEKDAVNLIGMRNRRWEGHYYQFNPLPGDIVDVTKQLPQGTSIDVEYISVGGQEIPIQQNILPENQQEPLEL